MQKILILFFTLSVLVSCKKDQKTCYTYTVKEYCLPKVAGVFSCQTPIYKQKFKDCNFYEEGQTVVRFENADLIMYNKYTDRQAN